MSRQDPYSEFRKQGKPAESADPYAEFRKAGQPTTSPAAEEPRSPGGFARNVAASGARFVGNLAEAVTSPLQTAKAVGDLAVGAVKRVASPMHVEPNSFDALIGMYVERYGGVEKLKKTAYDDPIGLLADFSMVAGGAGGVAKGAQMAGLTRAGHVANVMGKVSRATDPLSVITKPVGAIARRVGSTTLNPNAMYQSALKPPPGSHSTAEVGRMVETGLEHNIPVNASGLEKLGDLIDDLQTKVRATIDVDPARPISPRSVAGRINQVVPKFTTQVNPVDDLRAIGSSKREFLKQHMKPGKPGTPSTIDPLTGVKIPGKPAVPPQEIPIDASRAQAIKQGTYRQLKGKAYGELKSASIEAQKALARGLKEELVNAFPELASLNEKESRFIQLTDVLERAVRRIDNHQLFGIGTPIAAAGAQAVTGSPKIALAVGAMRAVLDNPQMKSRLAIALHHANKYRPQGRIPRVGTAAERVQEFLDNLQMVEAGAIAQQ